MKDFRLYGQIEKVEERDDGTLVVHGIASTESRDADGEVITAAAMRDALPDYLRFGAIREMHQPIAAGTALGAEVGDDGVTRLEAHVVDPVACKKVRTGTYKGFSIGGKVKPNGRNKKDPSVIESLSLTEISLVDRPANPDAVFQLVKFDGGAHAAAQEPHMPEQTVIPGTEAVTVTEPAPVVATTITAPVEKSMQAVWDSRVALDALATVSALYESEMTEGHPEAGEQTAALKAAIEALKNFIASEIQETEPDTLVAFAAKVEAVKAAAQARTEAVAKAGARFSRATKAALKAAHDAVRACDKTLADLGYEDHDDEAEEEEEEEQPEKAAAPKGDDVLVKVNADLAKADKLAKTLTAERDALAKRLEAAESRLAAKGALRGAPVEKAQDGGAAAPAPEPEPATALDAIRKAHQSPRFVLSRG